MLRLIPVLRLLTLASRVLPFLIGSIALLTTIVILIRTHHGPVISYDSFRYISVAENLADGQGLIHFHGRPLVKFPPGYPLMLAPFELFGIGAREASRFLNALLFGSTVLMSGLWLRTVCRSVGLVVVATLAIAGPTTYHRVASAYLSEPLYMFVTIGSLILICELLRRGGDPASKIPPP